MSELLRTFRLPSRRVLMGLALLILLALLLVGCEVGGVDTPQNTFDTKGQPAEDQEDIFTLAMWPAIFIMFLVLGGLVVIMLRFRRRHPDELPKQLHGNTRLEFAWTLAPALLLLVLAVPMIATLLDVSRAPAKDAFPVTVTGFRFDWIFEYPEILDENGDPVITQTEVHVPVGREIAFTITAEDVIHSFWVPKMAGKLDAVPGQQNVMWARLDEAGSYSGQCAELCGIGHALMRLTLIAQDDEDFDKWIDEVAGSQEPQGSGGG